MSTAGKGKDPEDLLAHDAFVRGLARHLVHDGHAAEDIAQQTWVASLQAGSGPLTSLRAWLAGVVRRVAGKRARTERHEHERQRAAARQELVPSAAEIVAREAQRAQVVRAVLELDEPYRAVVLLRWFENLPPRAIARRLGVPVETVRTRHKRALALLRSRLDREHGGAWRALILPYAGKAVGSFVAAAELLLLPGVLYMTTKVKIALATAALGGLLFVAWWSTSATPFEERRDAASQPAVEMQTAAVPPESAGVALPDAPEAAAGRKAVPVSAATTGTLLVRAIWGDDKTPAPGVVLELTRHGEDDLFDRRQGTTGADGCLRLEGLRPGRVWLEPKRGDTSGWERAEVVAGQVTESTIEIQMGMNANGVVVDGSGAPVCGAEVLVAGWAGGLAVPLARTGAAGRFRLRAIGTHCHVGARAPGYAASPLRQFTAGKGAEVEMRIVLSEPAARLTGIVLGPENRPVAGAVVQAGSPEQRNQKLPDGGVAMGPRPERAVTDAEGRFTIDHLPGGQVPVAVRARGLAPHHQTAAVEAGKANELTLLLLPGVTLSGTVRDGSGAAVAKAEVRVGGWDDLGHQRVTTSAKGEYRLEGLWPGKIAAAVTSEAHGTTSTTLEAIAGQSLNWDPVLSAGLVLRGLVLDAADKPVYGAMVEARAVRPRAGTPWWGFENTDAQGRFQLQNCSADQPIRITVRRQSMFPEVVLAHVIPGTEELVVRLPKEAWIHIQGKVVDPDDAPLANVKVLPSMKGGDSSPAETTEAGTGAFKLGPYPPGEYTMRLQADGFAPIRLPPRAVGPDEVWDLGTVKFQRGGSLAVVLISPGATPLPKMSLSIYDTTGAYVDRVEVDGGNGHSGPLAPGSYEMQVLTRTYACVQHPFDVREGIETRLDVPLRTGVPVALEFPAKGGQATRSVAVVIRDAAGAVALRSSAYSHDGPAKLEVALLPGDYRIEASAGPCQGAGSLAVKAPGPVRTSVELGPR
jgi:RNA polymerase sigma-70 factor (ECF subfamily)